MTGNGLNTTYKNGDDVGMVYGIVLPTFTCLGVTNRHISWHFIFMAIDGLNMIKSLNASLISFTKHFANMSY